MRNALVAILVVVLLGGGFFALNRYIYSQKHGEPADLSLTSKTWVWESTLINDGREITPEKKDAFTLTFEKEGTFSGTTDCNHLSGGYRVDEKLGQISFGDIAMTKMYCEGSQEAVFALFLRDVAEYHIAPSGELVLGLKFDSGSVIFR